MFEMQFLKLLGITTEGLFHIRLIYRYGKKKQASAYKLSIVLSQLSLVTQGIFEVHLFLVHLLFHEVLVK